MIIEEKSDERVRARIKWVDGEEDTHIEFEIGNLGRRMIWEMASQGMKPKEIARILKEKDIKTSKGRPWLPSTISSTLYYMRKEGQFQSTPEHHRRQPREKGVSESHGSEHSTDGDDTGKSSGDNA